MRNLKERWLLLTPCSQNIQELKGSIKACASSLSLHSSVSVWRGTSTEIPKKCLAVMLEKRLEKQVTFALFETLMAVEDFYSF